MWIDEATAIRAAERALLAQEMLGEHSTQVAREGRPGQPLLVERLDRVGVGYYLIPWGASRGTELIVRVDASTGEFLGLVQLARPTTSCLLSASEALVRARTELPGADLGYPRAVWRPCRQSTTPNRPFYEVSFEDGVLYVDMDGMVHRVLTPLGRGG